MNFKLFYPLLILVFTSTFINSQQNYLVDSYEDPSLWTQVGEHVEVSNNEVNFINLSFGGEQRRVFRTLNDPLLFEDDWKFSFDFIFSELGSYQSNPSVGHTLLSLTEDNEETGRLCPDITCTGNPRSDTDYISVYYGNDLDGGDTRFSINTKINGVFKDSPFVFFYTPNKKLFFELEKVQNTLFLSIYEDIEKTILLNNQIVSVEICPIEPLNYIQHGVSAAAHYERGLTGKIDNLNLDKNFASGCEIIPLWYTNETSLFSNFEKNIGIGTSDAQSKLSVVGNVGVDGDLTAKNLIARPIVWPDYVFSDKYLLQPLEEVEAFIKLNSHLPKVPTEEEILENGNDLGSTDALLLEKIEELTLYIIDLNKRIKELEADALITEK